MDATPRWLLPAVLALHGALVIALVTRPAMRPPLALPMAMHVELLAPPVPNVAPRSEAPRMQPPRPAPQPRAVRPEPAPRLASVATPSAPAPEPAPAAAPATASAAPAPVQAAPAPPVPTAPRFDAAYLNNPAPAYPPLARRLGEQGRVFLRVLVSADGAPQQVELKNGSGSPRLDQAALEAVRRWRFIPARLGAESVAAWVVVPIAFNLESST